MPSGASGVPFGHQHRRAGADFAQHVEIARLFSALAHHLVNGRRVRRQSFLFGENGLNRPKFSVDIAQRNEQVFALAAQANGKHLLAIQVGRCFAWHHVVRTAPPPSGRQRAVLILCLQFPSAALAFGRYFGDLLQR